MFAWQAPFNPKDWSNSIPAWLLAFGFLIYIGVWALPKLAQVFQKDSITMQAVKDIAELYSRMQACESRILKHQKEADVEFDNVKHRLTTHYGRICITEAKLNIDRKLEDSTRRSGE